MPKGRPAKYDTNIQPHLEQISEMLEAGVTKKVICEKLKIGRSTLYKYLKEAREGDENKKDLIDAIARGEEFSVDEVEHAMFDSAKDRVVKVKKLFKLRRYVYDPATGRKIEEYDELVEGEEEVVLPASVNAQMFILTNLARQKWQYKPEPVADDNEGETGVVVVPPVKDKPQPPEET